MCVIEIHCGWKTVGDTYTTKSSLLMVKYHKEIYRKYAWLYSS